MADPCKDDFGVPEAAGINGRETLALLRLFSRGFGALATLLKFVASTVFNLQVLADAAPFATDQTTARKSIVPDAVEVIYVNKSGTYLAVFVQAESYVLAGTVISSGLFVDTDPQKCTQAAAKRRAWGSFPSMTFWVPPNTSLYALVPDSSSGAQSRFGITITPVPLRGTGAYFGSGEGS